MYPCETRATEIGYSGYPELQRAMQEMIRSRLTSVQRLEITSQNLEPEQLLNAVLNQDIDIIRQTIEETSHEVCIDSKMGDDIVEFRLR